MKPILNPTTDIAAVDGSVRLVDAIPHDVQHEALRRFRWFEQVGEVANGIGIGIGIQAMRGGIATVGRTLNGNEQRHHEVVQMGSSLHQRRPRSSSACSSTTPTT